MSKHTEGRLIVLNSFLVQEAHANRKIGGASDPKRDHDEYAHYIADVKGKRDYHNSEANARCLAAAWNACEGVATEQLEIISVLEVEDKLMDCIGSVRNELNAANVRIAKLEALVAERDAMLGKRPCQNNRCNELNAARALLREVVENGVWCSDAGENYDEALELELRINAYLDACDKPGEPDAS